LKVLLDTNAYSDWKRGHEGVTNLIRQSEKFVISSIVVGELLYGFRCGSRYQANVVELHELLNSQYVELLTVTLDTADRFARIAESLKTKGKPIPSNDIWIAAHAMETGSCLISRDLHFANIDGLFWISPTDPGCSPF
jgi:tRNA(fMet)-specific endonuclease VapC